MLGDKQEALQETIELIIVENNILSTEYELLEKMGRLSPATFDLSTLENNYEKDYEAVKNIWLGFDG